jgi:hypothetical protein
MIRATMAATATQAVRKECVADNDDSPSDAEASWRSSISGVVRFAILKRPLELALVKLSRNQIPHFSSIVMGQVREREIGFDFLPIAVDAMSADRSLMKYIVHAEGELVGSFFAINRRLWRKL